jgi:hypothetical protein
MIIDVYITKYALKRGIFNAQVEHCIDYPGMVQVVFNDHATHYVYFHGEGKEWHRTLEAAKAKAEAMRDKKIASLEKKIAKLKAMTFEGVKE